MQLVKKFIINNGTPIALGIIFIFVLWYIFSASIGKGNLVFPSINETFFEMGNTLNSKYFYASLGMTLYRTFLGFIISFAIALVLGLFAGSIKFIYKFLIPLMSVLKSIPTATLVFFIIALSKVKYAPIYIVVLLAMPILYEAISAGIGSTEKEVLDASKVDGASYLDILFRIRLPLSLPYIGIGLLSSFALSLKTEIMAEIVSGNTGDGLGCMISAVRSTDPGNLAVIFAIAVICVIIVLVISALAYLAKKIIYRFI